MSNIKSVEITGNLPFTCAENEKMSKFLAQMNAPVMGIRISWGSSFSIPNNHGGKTAIYNFGIYGEEAVSSTWIEQLLLAIIDAEGNVDKVKVTDIENNYTLDFKIPQK